MVNKKLRDRRIFKVLKFTLQTLEGITCEEIYFRLSKDNCKTGVKSSKALSKILPRFPLIKTQKVVTYNDNNGISFANYVTIYKLNDDYKEILKRNCKGYLLDSYSGILDKRKKTKNQKV